MPSSTTNPQGRMIRLIRAQPPDATYDDILRELALNRMVDQGLADVREGNTLTHAQLKKRARSWRK